MRYGERPSMPQRYKMYMEAADLMLFVKELREVYEETASEKALNLYNRFKAYADDVMDSARQVEIELNRQDFFDILSNPQEFPFSVVTWAHKEQAERDKDEKDHGNDES